MSTGRWQLPEHWSWAAAKEIGQIVGGGTPKATDETNFSNDGVPWITPADLTGYDATYIIRGRRDLSPKGYRSSGATIMPAGTVLFSSRAPVGYCVIAANEISTNQGFKSLVINEGILPEYIRYYLLASREYAESLASGTTFLELSGARMKMLTFPIPPTAEQKRIVAKLDNLFARIKAARNELNRIAFLISRHKQAILDLVFRRYESQDVSTLADIVDPDRGIPYGIVQTGSPHTGGVPTVRGGDIKQYTVLINELKKVAPKIEKQYLRTRLKGGEVLISIRGTVGNSAVVDPEMTGFNISREVALIPVGKKADSKFVMYYLSSSEAQRFLLGHVKGVAQRGINLRDLKNLKVPLPVLTHQRKTVREIEDYFQRLDIIVSEYSRALELLDYIEKTICEKAFRGELVPQDSNDEPAAVLLERIREERAQADAASRRGRRGKGAGKQTTTRKGRGKMENKKRSDVGEEHLSELLQKLGGSVEARELWQKSEMDVNEFYKLLRDEVKAGRITESDDKERLEIGNAA